MSGTLWLAEIRLTADQGGPSGARMDTTLVVPLRRVTSDAQARSRAIAEGQGIIAAKMPDWTSREVEILGLRIVNPVDLRD